MQFCLIYPNMHPYCYPDVAVSTALAAEDAGFHSILVWDHYSQPEGPETLDAWNLLAYLSAKTSTIKLGTCVTPVPLRPPAILAKQVSTVDILSNGRAILGIGAGWHPQEFEGYSQWDPISVRVSRVEEGLDLILRLWSEEEVDFQGEFYHAKGALLEPKPVQKPHPPLWFGAIGKRMLKLAARHGDGWIPDSGLIPPAKYKTVLGQIKQERKSMGISAPFDASVQVYDPSLKEARDYLRVVEEYQKAGCEICSVTLPYPAEEMSDRIKWFAKEVMPQVS